MATAAVAKVMSAFATPAAVETAVAAKVIVMSDFTSAVMDPHTVGATWERETQESRWPPVLKGGLKDGRTITREQMKLMEQAVSRRLGKEG